MNKKLKVEKNSDNMTHQWANVAYLGAVCAFLHTNKNIFFGGAIPTIIAMALLFVVLFIIKLKIELDRHRLPSSLFPL
ncbi:hypothetical protein GC177_09010 [bacterium]|nr:hypothetical protein [bacterium]